MNFYKIVQRLCCNSYIENHPQGDEVQMAGQQNLVEGRTCHVLTPATASSYPPPKTPLTAYLRDPVSALTWLTSRTPQSECGQCQSTAQRHDALQDVGA